MTTGLKDKTKTDNTEKDNTKNLNSIIFCGGEKGGVGKSFFARCLLNYFVSKGWQEKFVLIEADPTISDVSFVYKQCEKIVFSDNKFDYDQPNAIVDKIGEKSTIVNLPSNVRNQFDDWATRISIFTDEEMKQIYEEINYFFVSDGCYQSIQQFILHVEKYKNTEMNNCLVLNTGRLTCGGDFSYLEKDESLIKIIQDWQIPVIALPELGSRFQFECDKEGLSYSEFLSRPGVKVSDKTPLRQFLKQLEQLFSKIFPNKVAKAEGLSKIAEEQADKRKEGKLKAGTKDPDTRLVYLY